MLRHMKRTTIRLEDHLLREAKSAAARSGRTLTALIEDALRAAIYRRPPEQGRGTVEIPTFAGTGTLPGVDLDDSAALADLMDRGGPA